ncbi:MAG: hypothetical protein AMXMBFR84_35350 [Candidatus Hydrogenedentota bacterium]
MSDISRFREFLYNFVTQPAFLSGELMDSVRFLTRHSADLFCVDRVYVWRLPEGDSDRATVVDCFEQGHDNAGAPHFQLSPSVVERVVRLHTVSVHPGESGNGIQSSSPVSSGPTLELHIPVFLGSRLAGALSLETRVAPRAWDDTTVSQCRELAGLIAHLFMIDELRFHKSTELRVAKAYQIAIDAAGAAPYVQVYDPSAYTFMGNQITRITGYTPEEFTPQLLDTIVLEYILRGPGTGMALEDAIQRARRGEFDYWQCDMAVKTKSGDIRWISEISVEFIGSDGLADSSTGIILDITDRVVQEKEIQRIEGIYRSAITAAGAIPYVHTYYPVEKYSFLDARIADLIGYPMEEITPSMLTSITVEDFVIGEGEVSNPDKVIAKYRGGESKVWVSDFSVRTRTGQIIWFSDAAVELIGSNGQSEGSIGLLQDITQRKRSEAALLDSEKRSRALMEASFEGIAVTDGGRIVEVNTALLKILGYSREELVGNELSVFVEADDWELVNSRIRDAFERPYEYRMIRKDGSVIDVEVRGTAITLGGRECWSTAIRDITERKRAEEERQHLITAIEQTSEIVVITDIHGTIQYVNAAFERVTGYTRIEALGQNPRILKSGEHPLSFYQGLWEVLLRGEPWIGRIVNKKKDGSLYTEDAVITPVQDMAGNIVNYVAVKRDITGELKLEEQYRQSQKMEAIGQLAGGVAHDFNNLLQVILGYTGLLLEGSGLGESDKGALREVHKAAVRAAELTQQLLSFSRRQIIKPVNLDMNVLIDGVIRMIRRVIGEHIELRFMPGRKLGTVYGDKGQLEQILMNLCVNARDAMPDGGTLMLDTQDIVIDKQYCAEHPWAVEGRYVCLSVSDTGHGMDKATSTQIFEPFFTTKDVGQGTGLGLATVYGIVKQHNGLIHVYSEPGMGTVFRVYLPAVESPVESDVQPREEIVEGGSETILVAEDEEMVRELAVRMLESGGYRVFAASDGETALQMCEQHGDSIDLALLDVMMPKYNGREVMDRIQSKFPRIRFLFSSGYSHDGIHTNFVIEKGLKLVSKPYRRSDLLREVRQILNDSK